MASLVAGVIGRSSVSSLEPMVRPFASPTLYPFRTRKTVQGGTDPSGDVKDTEGNSIPSLSWSARASVDVITLGARGYTITWPDKPEDLFEIDRTTHTVRVENPDDPSQYVDVEVIDSVTLQDASQAIRRFAFSNGS